MPSIFQIKEQTVTDTPLLLFDCQLASGQTEHWSTHQIVLGGTTYAARVLRHNVFEIQTSSDQGVDTIPRVALALANADSHFSQLERAGGFKGARITVRFLFFDLRASAPASDISTVFLGIANAPDEITDSTFRLSAINRMSLQRVLIPEIRIQRRCPWDFPATADQRQEAATGGTKGKYSRFYRCGYSPDITDGAGNLNGTAPYTSCGFTRADCEARGMFGRDSTRRVTQRFGGIEFVPAPVAVRSHGEKGTHLSPVTPNEARYNDFVPLIYGTVWYSPSIVFTRNDGNLTRMEVLLGLGEIQDVVKVLVNDVEIPAGVNGANMTGTGWFNLIGAGTRTGAFNPDFTNASGNPLGDPYGSMAFLSVVVPNQINDGRALPSIKALVRGVKLAQYGTDGSFLGEPFSANPAWIVLDILRKCGWTPDEIDLASFAETAAYCDERIQSQDLNGNTISIPRFECNVAIQQRRTAGDLLRAIRNSARFYLSYDSSGLLRLRVENTLALQQPSKPAWSNSMSTLNGGWPSYEFGDGSTPGMTGILRRANGEPSIRVWSRSTTDTPNRFAIEFQDALNEYQQDSFSLVDVEDVARAGQEIAAPLAVLGVPNYDQAARIVKFNLDKSVSGNTYVEFETSVKAFGIQPGDLITLTYLKEGFLRRPFRVLKIAPATNYRTARITGQIHEDAWYSDTNGQTSGNSAARRQPGAGVGLPLPLTGNVVDANGDIQYGVVESSAVAADGSSIVNATVSFAPPAAPQPGGPAIPLLSLSPGTANSGGTLAGGQTLSYAVTSVDGAGQESNLSFIVRAVIPGGPDTNTVTLSGLSFPVTATSFNVYRGVNPLQLFRIASNQPIAGQFTDTGLARQPVPPPDTNYDHANFYWRLELETEYAATLHSPQSVGNSALQMTANAYAGMTVRITRGRGAGQERAISSNSITTLNVSSVWGTEPDGTSFFTVAEAGWHFSATGKTSPVQFSIPNRTGATIHIAGRAANVNDVESPLELCTVTRWVIGGAGTSALDADVPPTPAFGLGLSTRSGGTVELSGVSFSQLTNTRTISSGTLTLHYWDELSGAPQESLVSAIGPSDTLIDLNQAGSAQPGGFIQLEAEIARVDALLNNGTRYQLTRGMHGSTAVSHGAPTPVYELQEKVQIVPFARDFFGSPASGSWSYPVLLPDCRVASGELFVTNVRGNSPTFAICLTQTTDFGLRTLSGGQYSFQLEGFLAIETGATPDLSIEETHSVRDVYAIVRDVPGGADIQVHLTLNGSPYCSLVIPDGAGQSSSVPGFGLPVLTTGSRLSLDIGQVGQTRPGADLTVVIRL